MDKTKQTYINLGKNIRKYREKKGITQEALCDMLQVNQKFIGHVERVERHISLNKLIRLCQILDIPLKDMCDFTNLE